ncbi:MAG: UDP-N-acetylmuramoyl-L-alanine--D-glutamate ligase [Gammaproteobacteria bacterium]
MESVQVQSEKMTAARCDSDHKAVIIGLGSTGVSCARYFTEQGIEFKVVDSRSEPPGVKELMQIAPRVETEFGGFRAATLSNAGMLVVSPGVSLKTPEIVAAMEAGVPVTGDIDIFAKTVEAPIIAVTGSNGKSTVVALVAEILRAAGLRFGLGGNLDGINFKPALALLEEEPKELYLLEVSSFQLETTQCLGAEVAVILNISADHLDRYESLDEYRRAKQRIFNGCSHVVINRDDPGSYPLQSLGVPVIEYGCTVPGSNGLGLLEEGNDQYLAYQFEKIISVSELNIVGLHNVSNVLAAIALALSVGVEMDKIKTALRRFKGLPHRCQWVAKINGVDFYNDSKGTNVGATLAAVEGLGQRIDGHILLIAGGMGKGADFSPLRPVLNRWTKEVILIGQDAVELSASIDSDIQTHFAESMHEAVKVALAHARPGDAVLLSPACASFDMFKNFQHRGEVFMQAVESLQ